MATANIRAAEGADTKVIGLVGGIGVGKSTVRHFLAQLGCTVIDADKIAWGCYAPGTDCFKAVVAAFGDAVVAEDGTINRRALGGIVFGDKAQMERLNGIVWPAIAVEIKAQLAALRAQANPPPVIVIEAAVLLQANWQSHCDEVWYVTAPKEAAIERLASSRKLSREEVEKRMASQTELHSLATQHAHVTIENTGDKAALAKQLKALLKSRLGAAPYDEIVQHVNEKNELLGNVPRSQTRANNLWHRATTIFARTSDGKIWVQKRAYVKDYCPGMWDPAAGGVVGAGEDLEESAKREAEEELGVMEKDPAAWRHLFDFPYQDNRTKVWTHCWDVLWDGPTKGQFEEVDELQLWTVAQAIENHHSGKAVCTPDGFKSLVLYQDYLNKLQATTARRRALQVAGAVGFVALAAAVKFMK